MPYRKNREVTVQLVPITLTDLGLTANASEINVLDGITLTTAELNILDGVTATATELNALAGSTVSPTELAILAGATLSTAELNVLDGIGAGVTAVNLTTLTDDSMADALHRHSELSASDGAPDPAISVAADGILNIDTGLTFSVGAALKIEVVSGTVWTLGWWQSTDTRWWLLGNTGDVTSFTRAQAEFHIPTGDIADVPAS